MDSTQEVNTIATVNRTGMLTTRRYKLRRRAKQVTASAPAAEMMKNSQPIEPTAIVISAATTNVATRPRRPLASGSSCAAAEVSRAARWFRFLASDTPEDSTALAGLIGISSPECGEIYFREGGKCSYSPKRRCRGSASMGCGETGFLSVRAGISSS